MRIDSWPLDRIMQLPDCCFGRRWPIGVATYSVTLGEQFDISEVALPDVCVIWHLSVFTATRSVGGGILRLSLGDRLPATLAEFENFERLFRDVGFGVLGTRNIISVGYEYRLSLPMRNIYQPQGRRVVMSWVPSLDTANMVQVILVVSGIPREVPDWLNLEKGSYR